MNKLSILEQVNRIDPDGNVAQILEVLDKNNPIFSEATAQLCNDTRSHVTTIRQNLGTAIQPRQINAGASYITSDVINVRDEVMLLEGRVQIDEQIVESSPSPDALRMSEITAAFENLTQDFTEYFFYGDGDGPGTMKGLGKRFNNYDLANVHTLGGSTGSLTSLYIVEWGVQTCSLIYPKNSTAGIMERDKGKQTVYSDSGSKPYEAYENIISLQMGLSVPDPRAVQRICNIQANGLDNSLVQEDEWGTIIDAISLLPSMGRGAVCYVNRTTYSQIQQMAFLKSNAAFTYAEVTGQIVLFVFGIPVRMMEGVSITEDVVPGTP